VRFDDLEHRLVERLERLGAEELLELGARAARVGDGLAEGGPLPSDDGRDQGSVTLRNTG
jgi:hypothetical protein